MKRILSYVLFLALALEASAQITILDVLKKSGVLSTASAQSGVVREALLPSLSIIRQQYRLQKGEDYYGKNNLPYYGESYSLAVKVAGGTLFLGDVMRPWAGDADYSRANASGNYVPSLFWTYQRMLSDSVYHSIDFELYNGPSPYVQPLNADSSLYIHLDKKADLGLCLDKGLGRKNGYMVWACSRTSTKDSAMTVDLRLSPLSIAVSADSVLVSVSPDSPEKIIGGVYVVPIYESGGRVQFLLAGMAVRNGDKAWSLQLLAADGKGSRGGITKSDITRSMAKGAGESKADSKKKRRK